MTINYPNGEAPNSVTSDIKDEGIKDLGLCHHNFNMTQEEKQAAKDWIKEEFEARFTFKELLPRLLL